MERPHTTIKFPAVLSQKSDAFPALEQATMEKDDVLLLGCPKAGEMLAQHQMLFFLRQLLMFSALTCYCYSIVSSYYMTWGYLEKIPKRFNRDLSCLSSTPTTCFDGKVHVVQFVNLCFILGTHFCTSILAMLTQGKAEYTTLPHHWLEVRSYDSIIENYKSKPRILSSHLTLSQLPQGFRYNFLS